MTLERPFTSTQIYFHRTTWEICSQDQSLCELEAALTRDHCITISDQTALTKMNAAAFGFIKSI